MMRSEMKYYNTILTEKQAKILTLSSGNINKYEYYTGEGILPSNQSRVIEQAKFNCSPSGKALAKSIKQAKTIEDQRNKIDSLKVSSLILTNYQLKMTFQKIK